MVLLPISRLPLMKSDLVRLNLVIVLLLGLDIFLQSLVVYCSKLERILILLVIVIYLNAITLVMLYTHSLKILLMRMKLHLSQFLVLLELEKLIYSKITQPQEILHSPVLLQKGLHLLQKLLVRYPLQELQKNLIRERTSLVLDHSLLSMELQRNSDSIQLVELFFMTLVDLLLQELKKNIQQLDSDLQRSLVLQKLELKENLEFLTLSYSKFLVNLIIQTFNIFPTIEVAEQSPYLDLGMNLLPEPTKEREDYSVLHLDLKLIHAHLTSVLVRFISVSLILMERQLNVQVASKHLLMVDYQVAKQKNATLNHQEHLCP